ncbi:hypothetical protein QCB45_09485 [Thiomicrorhabdus sp. ZW0627]|uniref:hypothetical protein n=1 Tax=Thiomicrorhabdus sp. ZW0627 TaxID=3039774 RepID=UPI002436E78B|nr:hypothetical protein [Thiomicrorhabdus sp. ZW0627]MDG6774564.1 hypothetical protein [Thiomicrorhabdus sp. ZW0627]
MSEQMEYLFFDKELAQRFSDFCSTHSIQAEMEVEETPSGENSYCVKFADDLNDETLDQIEDTYNDMFFGEQAAQIEGNDSSGALADACGVQVMLQSGEYTTVAIHPEIMNKILSVLTVDELQKFLSQVAEDIENPKSGPICRREDLPVL